MTYNYRDRAVFVVVTETEKYSVRKQSWSYVSEHDRSFVEEIARCFLRGSDHALFVAVVTASVWRS